MPKFSVFTVLHLATACYTFTKLLHLLVRYWHSQGLRALLYLDNGVVAVTGKETAEQATGHIKNSAKYVWEPTLKLLKWLGFDLGLWAGLILVPEEKLATLKIQLQVAAKEPCIKAR